MIDFFDYVDEELSDEVFYIRDEQNQTKVKLIKDRLDATKENCVRVLNDLRKSIKFIPVDSNSPLKKLDGQDESSCDAFLFEPERATFIEIKDVRNSQNHKAKEQLKNTIRLFDEYHSNMKVRRQAYLCDLNRYFTFYSEVDENGYEEKMRRYLSKVSTKEDKETFLSEYKTRFYVGNDVYV